jgi:hypothetical protein
MRPPLVVSAFKDELKAGGPQTVCVGPRAAVQDAVSRNELTELFGGYILYVDRITGAEFLGIWGARKTSAFRSVLRSRGLSVEIKRRKPGNLRVKLWVTR